MLLQLENISKNIGVRYLFCDVILKVEASDRLALIGSNGAGKTTLLNIVDGLEDADSGQVVRAKNIKIGYLKRQVSEIEEEQLFAEVLKSCQGILDLEEQIEQLQLEIEAVPNEENFKKLGDLQAKFETEEGYKYAVNCRTILFGLGFTEADLERYTSEFSDGWLMRITLANVLIQQPDLMLLEEPTNHLDMEILLWFEFFLKKYSGAFMIVSHDCETLDSLVNRVVEPDTSNFSCPTTNLYKGNYSCYFSKTKNTLELLCAKAENRRKISTI